MGIEPTAGRGRGRGTIARGRGRGGRGNSRGRGRGRGTMTLDNRTTTIWIESLPEGLRSDEEQLRAHFKNFGEISVTHVSRFTLVKFDTRRGAELGLQHGKTYRNEVLKMGWHTPSPPRSIDSGESMGDQIEPEEIVPEVYEHEHSLDDVSNEGYEEEDEDEHAEERNWKR